MAQKVKITFKDTTDVTYHIVPGSFVTAVDNNYKCILENGNIVYINREQVFTAVVSEVTE